VVEQRNQTIMAIARSMINAKGMSNYLWGEAVLTAIFVLNQSFTRSVSDMTPYEAAHVWLCGAREECVMKATSK
jgi:hypothetical protein